MAKGLVMGYGHGPPWQLNRGDCITYLRTDFRPSQGPFVADAKIFKFPLGAKSRAAGIIWSGAADFLPGSCREGGGPPAGPGGRVGRESEVVETFVNRLTGGMRSPCKVFPCAAREGGGAGSLPRNLDNRILRMEFERRTIRLLGCQTDIRESKLNFFPVRGPKAPTESFKTESRLTSI